MTNKHTIQYLTENNNNLNRLLSNININKKNVYKSNVLNYGINMKTNISGFSTKTENQLLSTIENVVIGSSNYPITSEDKNKIFSESYSTKVIDILLLDHVSTEIQDAINNGTIKIFNNIVFNQRPSTTPLVASSFTYKSNSWLFYDDFSNGIDFDIWEWVGNVPSYSTGENGLTITTSGTSVLYGLFNNKWRADVNHPTLRLKTWEWGTTSHSVIKIASTWNYFDYAGFSWDIWYTGCVGQGVNGEGRIAGDDFTIETSGYNPVFMSHGQETFAYGDTLERVNSFGFNPTSHVQQGIGCSSYYGASFTFEYYGVSSNQTVPLEVENFYYFNRPAVFPRLYYIVENNQLRVKGIIATKGSISDVDLITTLKII